MFCIQTPQGFKKNILNFSFYKGFIFKKLFEKKNLIKFENIVLKKLDNYFLLEINLETGRHHQIRVQLSNIGCPIKGDLKYGFDRSNKDASISLHARYIEFIHPVSNEPVKITADLPNDPIWNACL